MSQLLKRIKAERHPQGVREGLVAMRDLAQVSMFEGTMNAEHTPRLIELLDQGIAAFDAGGWLDFKAAHGATVQRLRELSEDMVELTGQELFDACKAEFESLGEPNAGAWA